MKESISSRQTKLLLAQTLKSKMLGKPLSKITVTSFIKDCKVNRRTFYYHFDNLYKLLEWLFDQEALELIRNAGDSQNLGKGLLELLQYIRSNEAFCRSALASIGYERLSSMLSDALVQALDPIIDSIILGRKADKAKIDFIAMFYASATAQALARWMQSDLGLTAEEMLAMIKPTLESGLAVSVEKAMEA